MEPRTKQRSTLICCHVFECKPYMDYAFFSNTYLLSFLHHHPYWKRKLHFYLFLSPQTFKFLKSDFISYPLYFKYSKQERIHRSFWGKIITCSQLTSINFPCIVSHYGIFLIFLILSSITPFTCWSTSLSSCQCLLVLLGGYC